MEFYFWTMLSLGVFNIIGGVVILALYDKMRHTVKTKTQHAIQLLLSIASAAWVAYLLLENF